MKKSAVLNTYLTAVMALAMTFAVACTGPGQSPTLSAQGKTADPNQQQQLADGPSDGAGGEDGTTDGNGGNGVNGKIYESYIVKLEELPAFKNIVKEKLEAMDKAWMAAESKAYPNEKQKPLPLFSIISKFKKWYVAPVSLKSLNKKTIGVEFTNESTDQLALQTESEIWIDSRLFEKEKMGIEDQARLILHEYVMSLYLLQFESLNDLCLLGQTNYSSPESFHCIEKGVAEKFAPAMKKRDLNKDDYARIRSVTETLFNNADKMSAQEISRTLVLQGFDKRLFEPSYISEGESYKVSMTAVEIVQALKHSVYSQNLDGLCQGVQSKDKIPCIVEIKNISSASKSNFAGAIDVELAIKDPKTQQIIRSVKANIYDTVTTQSSETFLYSLSTDEPTTEGERFGNVSLFLRKGKDSNYLDVLAVVFSKFVVTYVGPDNSSASQQGKNCLRVSSSILKTTSIADDALVAGNDIDVDSSPSLKYISTTTNHGVDCKK